MLAELLLLLQPVLLFLQEIGLGYISAWVYDRLKKEKDVATLQKIEKNT